ncbi:cytochrome b [Roseomonas frigidaquae]|uniref:Cytochrome b n=1 Tax=Falsiroseomonas frigidaquae TaxID=487318 RepID=A0ABX1F0I4_9PROT|nr:cytochrome b/b6 domain-containing protein [Falsiroseomonas frigidaquae]NKE45851.1 cytochrome b [Falsiroseomonas frigidaquae]
MEMATGSPMQPPIKGQDSLHPDGQYSALAKWFHWLTVPLLFTALATGLVIRFMKDDAKMPFYALHESLGLLILGLALARLAWRGIARPPALPDHLPRAMRAAAAGVHHALYAALIIQPLLGFMTTNAYGFPLQGQTAFLGFIDLPKFMEAAPGLANVLHWGHSLIGWAFPFLLAAHIGGAIFHHAIRRDGTLLRML